MGTLLVRGMLAGLVAAALALGFAKVFGEPQVDAAIALEEARGAAHSHGEPGAPAHEHGGEDVLVSRDVQSTVGLAVAVGMYGLAFGGLFALAFAFAYGRIGRLGARATSAAVAVGAFVAVFLVPFLKYPANPPAVGDARTIGDRTLWYFVMVLVSVVAAIASTVLARWLAGRVGTWNGALLGVLAYAGIASAAAVSLPSVDEVPAGFPAGLLWSFRLASSGTQLVLWAALGLVFGVLADRAVRQVTGTRSVAV